MELGVSVDACFFFFSQFDFNLIKHRTASFIIVFSFSEKTFLWLPLLMLYNNNDIKNIIIVIIIIRNAKDVLNSI